MLFPNIHLLGFGILFSYGFFCTSGEKPKSSVGPHTAIVRFSVLGCDLKMTSAGVQLLCKQMNPTNLTEKRLTGLQCYAPNNLLRVLIVIRMITEIRKAISSRDLFLHIDKYKSNTVLVPRC